MEMEHEWVTCLTGALPRLPVAGGNDVDGNTIYIGRVKIDNDFLTVNVTPDKSRTWTWQDNKEIEINEYEVLNGLQYEWVKSLKDHIPINAVKWDSTLNGETLYVGRGYHKGILCWGKVHYSVGCLYTQYDSKEIKLTDYEILVDKWVDATADSMPKDALECGCDADGDLIFVGRVFRNGNLMLANVIPNKGGAFVNCKSEQHKVENFQVLTGTDFSWVYCANDNIIRGAIPNGYSPEGDILFIGRAYHAGSWSVGKVYPRHGCIYLPIGDEEVEMKTYEVLARTVVGCS